MAVLLQTFSYSLTLKKLVHRTASYAGAASAPQQAIDLTKYLSENDTIRTVKSLDQPGGGFTITIADQLSTEVQDTIYALIEPMDLIEIRATRNPQKFFHDTLPLLMRGYVSTIQRTETIGDDGTPQRQVIIRGIDSGKIWQINQVLFQFLQASQKPFLDGFGLLASIGLDGTPLPAGDYMQKLVDYVNTKTQQLAGFGKQMLPDFKLISTVNDGQAWIQSIAAKNGPIWDYVEAYADRPWNEVFILDEETQPILYFRPAPYKDLTGKFILTDAADPGTVEVAAVEVIALDVIRSDAKVFNFFWCPPGDSTIDTGGFLTAAALANATPVETDYANDSPTLYGERILEVAMHLSPTTGSVPVMMMPPSERSVAQNAYLYWYLKRADDLRKMNRDNSVLEEGSATLNGREDLQIGKYLSITRGSVTSTSYMTQVAHTIAPLHSWVTGVAFKRGMGFYNRDKSDDFSWFAEGRPGPYTAMPKVG